ncbi:hypothetical protein [Salinirubrum litoreum]|uniref:Uncharacterized protein n=1 Tax=Salinirubrum litoreum TaxID=1126234 RepID=A0ABD5RFN2_9EURY|nr:hypothetical protein [Salinirubrum litoreum]
MTFGPYHTLRCKDDIAAALVDHPDEEDRPETSGPRETDGLVPDSASEVDSETASFLSDDEVEADVLTGPATSTDE